MPSLQLQSRINRIIEELGNLTEVTVAPAKPYGVSYMSDVDLLRQSLTVGGVTTTFIYGQGYHAFDDDCLDVLFDAPEGGIGECTYVDELYSSMACEVAKDIIHTITWTWEA